MKTILKYVVPIGLVQESGMQIPTNSRIVHVGPNTNGNPTEVAFWVEATQNAEYETRHFLVFGTGLGLAGRTEYVGTVIDTKLGAAWHLYEMSPNGGE